MSKSNLNYLRMIARQLGLNATVIHGTATGEIALYIVACGGRIIKKTISDVNEGLHVLQIVARMAY